MKIQISHRADPDGEFAYQVWQALLELHVEPRRDQLKSRIAEKETGWLREQLRKYDFFIPVITSAYLGDEWLSLELFEAMAVDVAREAPFVLPVIRRDAALPAGMPPDIRKRAIRIDDDHVDEGIKQLAHYFAGARQMFVIMKFGDPRLDSMYELVIKPIAREFGYTPLRIDELKNSGFISEQVLAELRRSAVVIADLTGERPNCYYEAGYADALGKEVILTIQTGSPVHFDLAQRRLIQWGTEAELRNTLHRWLTEIGTRLRGQALAPP